MSEKETGIYMVCGVQSTEDNDFGSVEVEGTPAELFTIDFKDASIVAMEVPMKIYSPSRDNLMMHQNAVSKVMEKNDTVIPVSFGNVFHSKEDVKVILENLYPQFEKLFPEIKGKIELGLKVVAKQDWLEKQAADDPQLSKMKAQMGGKSEAASYYDRIEIGGAAQKFFEALRAEVEESILEPLKEVAVSVRINDPINEKMLMNAAFLVDKDKEEAFDKKVNDVHEEWEDKADFNYSGPWPAYNFVNIKLKVEDN